MGKQVVRWKDKQVARCDGLDGLAEREIRIAKLSKMCENLAGSKM